MNNHQTNEVREHHIPSKRGLWSILKTRKLFLKLPFLIAVILDIIFTIIFICNPDKSYIAIEKLTEIVTTCFPCLLGFSLAGYAMVVGFPNTELIEQDSQAEDFTLYQVLSAFFALNIILQVFATAIAFCIWWVIKADVSSMIHYTNGILFNAVNILVIFILFFISVYAICLTPYIAINLFSLSQVNSMFFTIRKINKDDGTHPPSV